MNTDGITADLFVPAPLDPMEQDDINSPSVSFWQEAFHRLFKNKGAVISLVLLVLLIIVALIGPLMNEHTYRSQNLVHSNLPAKVPGLGWLGFDGTDIKGVDVYEKRNIETNYWFGTDEFGRDLWTRVWKGTQISLFIALVAAALDLVIGVVYGGISSFYGGRVDNVMQRIIEVLMGIPNLIIIILFILILEPGITSIILAMVITGWVGMARVVRGQILAVEKPRICPGLPNAGCIKFQIDLEAFIAKRNGANYCYHHVYNSYSHILRSLFKFYRLRIAGTTSIAWCVN